MNKNNKKELFNPEKWGLSINNIEGISKIFNNIQQRFGRLFKKNNRKYLKYYMKGLLEVEKKSTITEISREIIDPNDDGQNLQYYISDSKWDHKQIFNKIQKEILSHKDLSGGMLILDDTGFRKYGNHSIGCSRQYIGRDGKIELGQVCVGLGYYIDSLWTMVDSELYIPKNWFNNKSNKELEEDYYLPSDRKFMTKPELGLNMIKQACSNGLPFSTVSCDTWYGKDSNFRHSLGKLKLTYVCKLPSNSNVLLDIGLNGLPDKSFKDGQYELFPNNLVKSDITKIITNNDFQETKLEVRTTERGVLYYDCFYKPIKSKVSDYKNVFIDELLFVYKDYEGSYHFSVTNASLECSLKKLSELNSYEYFIERIFQDCKSNLGWKDLESRKYRSFMHHTCLVALCLWFIFLVKYHFQINHPPDKSLKSEIGIPNLPHLSTSNIIDFFRFLFPLKYFTIEDRINIVISHLIHRSMSIASKHRKEIREQDYSDS